MIFCEERLKKNDKKNKFTCLKHILVIHLQPLRKKATLLKRLSILKISPG